MKVLAVSVFLAVTMTTAYGLKCYTCEGGDSSVAEGSCGDTFDTEVNKDNLDMCNATANENFCRKRKSGVNHVYTNVERGCATQCEERNVIFVDRVTCCTTDGCNGGSDVKPALFVLLSSSALYMAFKSL